MSNDYAIIIYAIGTAVLMLFAFTLVIFLIVHKKKQYQNLIDKQNLQNTYQNQLLQSKLEVQEQSFKNFSEEIHDNVGQVLSIVKMQLYNIRNTSKDDETITKANDCTELIGKAINDLRNISHTLNSSYVSKVGLAEAIEKDFSYIRSAKGLQCTLHRSGQEYPLGNEQELLIFRIIQEAVGNSVKHASPTTIDIHLDYKPGNFRVVVEDNGKGFDTGTHNEGGIGLTNMQVRAGLLKGILEVDSSKDSGTVVRLELPV